MTIALFQLGIKDRPLLAAARRRAGGEEALVTRMLASAQAAGVPMAVLSTCERLEAYVLASSLEAAAVAAAMSRGVTTDSDSGSWERRVGAAAATHLFHVACGLDSRLIGEPHILGQVARAAVIDGGDSASSSVLTRLVQGAVASGRRVRARSGLEQAATSCVEETVAAVRRFGGANQRVRIAVLGSGAMAKELVSRLARLDIGEIVAIARHPERIGQGRVGPDVTVSHIGNLAAEVQNVNVVIAATSAAEHVVRGEMVSGRARPLLLVDLGMPENIDPAVRGFGGVTLLTLENLPAAVRVQREVLERARAMASESAERWAHRWLSQLESTSRLASARSEVA